MSSDKTFLTFLNKFIPLSEEEYNQYLAPFLFIRSFEKKSIITKAGEVENYFNFIIKGLVRKYFIKGRDEINTQISFEGHIIHAQESFHSQTISEYFVESIEPTSMLSISFADLEKAYSVSNKMQHLGRLVVTTSMVLKDRWQNQALMLSPRERFLRFVTKHSDLMQRVPQKYLASYLNIKPETFSRFKHLIRDYSRQIAAQEAH